MGQWSRIAGVNVVLKEDKEFAVGGKQKDSVREETNAVFGTTVMSVQNRHQKPLHPLSHQHQEVEVRREKEPQRQESVWEDQSTAVQKLLPRCLQ